MSGMLSLGNILVVFFSLVLSFSMKDAEGSPGVNNSTFQSVFLRYR